MIKEKKAIQYRGFYLTACYTEKDNPVYIGTIYSKELDKYRWKTNHYGYPKIIYQYQIDETIDKMKEEVDKFLEKYKKYLEWRIEETKLELDRLLFHLNSLF